MVKIFENIFLYFFLMCSLACKNRENIVAEIKELPVQGTCFYGRSHEYRQELEHKIVSAIAFQEQGCVVADGGSATANACETLRLKLKSSQDKIAEIEEFVKGKNNIPPEKRPPCNDPDDLKQGGVIVASEDEFKAQVESAGVYKNIYSPKYDCDDFSNDLVKACSVTTQNSSDNKNYAIYRFNFYCQIGDSKLGHAIVIAPVQWLSGDLAFCAIEPQRDPIKQDLFDTCWDISLGRHPPAAITKELCLQHFQSEKLISTQFGELGKVLEEDSDRKNNPNYCSNSAIYGRYQSCYQSCCFGVHRRAVVDHMKRSKRVDIGLANKFINECYSSCDKTVPLPKQVPPKDRCTINSPMPECANGRL